MSLTGNPTRSKKRKYEEASKASEASPLSSKLENKFFRARNLWVKQKSQGIELYAECLVEFQQIFAGNKKQRNLSPGDILKLANYCREIGTELDDYCVKNEEQEQQFRKKSCLGFEIFLELYKDKENELTLDDVLLSPDEFTNVETLLAEHTTPQATSNGIVDHAPAKMQLASDGDERSKSDSEESTPKKIKIEEKGSLVLDQNAEIPETKEPDSPIDLVKSQQDECKAIYTAIYDYSGSVLDVFSFIREQLNQVIKIQTKDKEGNKKQDIAKLYKVIFNFAETKAVLNQDNFTHGRMYYICLRAAKRLAVLDKSAFLKIEPSLRKIAKEFIQIFNREQRLPVKEKNWNEVCSYARKLTGTCSAVLSSSMGGWLGGGAAASADADRSPTALVTAASQQQTWPCVIKLVI